MTEFKGDVLLEDTPDGGNLVIEDGLIQDDRGFRTAVYLSLFGGNMDDPAIIESNQSWWGNQIGDKETELRSSFQNVICSLPLTTKNLQAAEDAAKKDLQWIIDKGIGDEITVSGSIENIKEANFEIKLFKDGENVLDTTFGVEWEAMSNGI